MPSTAKSVGLLFGVTLASITAYLVYVLFKSNDEDEYDQVRGRRYGQTLEINVPKDKVRIIIGRNGKCIREIQEESNTRISFKQNDNDSTEQTCLIKGTADDCKVAENMVYDLLSSQPEQKSETISVPQAMVGRIVGKCGERIGQIRAMSGAVIKILDVDGASPGSSKEITLRGSAEQIQLAKSFIENFVREAEEMQKKVHKALGKREPRIVLTRVPTTVAEGAETPGAGACGAATERLSPTSGETQFEVYVSAMIDPSRFWVQIVGPKATKLDQLVEEMTDFYGRRENRLGMGLSAVSCGDIVAAMFSIDSKWYRAEVLELKSPDRVDDVLTNGDVKLAELYYVDYGDTETIPVAELCELRTDFLELHFQAIECFLSRVEPNGSDSWSDEAKDRFEEWTQVAQWKKLSAKINGYSLRDKIRAKREGSPVPGVDLFDVNNQKDVDIAQELVNHGYAVLKKESSPDKSSSSRTSTRSNDSM